MGHFDLAALDLGQFGVDQGRILRWRVDGLAGGINRHVLGGIARMARSIRWAIRFSQSPRGKLTSDYHCSRIA